MKVLQEVRTQKKKEKIKISSFILLEIRTDIGLHDCEYFRLYGVIGSLHLPDLIGCPSLG